MQIGIDYRPALHGRGGIAVYVRELAAALTAGFPDDRFELHGIRFRRPRRCADAAVMPSGNARLHAGRLPAPLQRVAARLGYGTERLLGGADVLHATDYVDLPSRKAPLVATIHDVLFEELPACYEPHQVRALRSGTRRLVRRARRILVPSDGTRAALLRHFDADPDRIDVVPHGLRDLPAVGPAREPGRYLLFVGTLEPRKNLARLLEAYDRAREVDGDLRLVVAGERGWRDEPLLEAIARRPGVRYVGGVDAARLGALYAGALAVAYPSLGEGFGLPVLEAMALGRPLLVGRDTVCAEIAGEAALQVDGHDTEAMGAALVRLVEDEALRERQSAEGRRRAAVYTWERAARATHAAYVRALDP